jgi:resuscitation-promoting factor RpfB
MPTKGVPGIPLAAMAAGGVLVWSGIYNVTITATLTSLLKGAEPAAGPKEQLVASTTASSSGGGSAASGDTTAHTATAKTNQAVGRLLATPYGWSAGTQWADLLSLWNQESGWDNTIANAGSGALGIAQALGHGGADTAGSLGNEYGAEYGLSAAEAAEANSGSAMYQIKWGLGYIHAQYGSPSAAWAHEQSANWY